MSPFKNASVAAKFESYPPVVRRKQGSTVTPDPSFQPTGYSGLHPLPSAGELKRWAS